MNLMELFVKIGVDDQASNKISSLTEKVGNGLAKASKVGVTAITSLGTAAIVSFANFEQLAGGAAKIFDELDQADVLNDANNAYRELGLSANQYLAIINDVGATFAATMGDKAGYETAQIGLKAISDYASGTGKNVDLLSEKFTMITRSTATYQSIADQFSGILPATSKDFLAQAQAAGILSDSYTELTQVPIAEYQSAVSQMLQRGVSELGLANNTVLESETTISGSFLAMKAAASNFMTAMVDDNADVGESFEILKETALTFFNNVEPKVWQFLSAISPISTVVAGTTAAFIAFKTAAAISGLLTTLTGAWKAYAIANQGATVAQWLLNAAMSANPIVLVVTLIAGLVAALVTLWKTNDNFRNAVIKTWTAIKTKAENIFGSVAKIFTEKIPNAFNSVIDWFKDIGKKFADIGKNIIDGIKEGISNAWDGLVTWFTDLFDGLVGGVKKLLGIHSPSRVFAGIGENMALGLGDGWDDQFGKIKNDINKSMKFDDVSIGINSSVRKVGSGQIFGGFGGVSVVQNIYSQAKTAADLMQEALYQQKRAVYIGV